MILPSYVGNGHGALAGMLSSLTVDTLICGGIGAGAQNALAEAGIRLYGGVSGSADEAVEDITVQEMEGSDMSRYEFTKNLETGNVTIDKEHRELIQAVNKLLDACSAGKGRASMDETIKFLNQYVQQHFSHEEQLQKRSGYPGITAHKAFHEKYRQTLKEITSRISASGPTIAELGALNQHISVLLTHISTEDKKLAAFLSQA